MYAFIVVLIVILAILLILVVVVQNSKGGGLVSGVTSVNQIIGVRRTTDLFEKITWWLAGLLIVFCIFASVLFMPHSQGTLEDSILKEDIMETIPQQQEQNDNTLPHVFNKVPVKNE